jgi:hypothetical protein
LCKIFVRSNKQNWLKILFKKSYYKIFLVARPTIITIKFMYKSSCIRHFRRSIEIKLLYKGKYHQIKKTCNINWKFKKWYFKVFTERIKIIKILSNYTCERYVFGWPNKKIQQKVLSKKSCLRHFCLSIKNDS